MENIDFISWAFSLLLAGFAYMLKRELAIKDEDIKNLKTEVQDIKRNYLHRDDFKEFKTELRSIFEEIKMDIRSLKPHAQS